MCSTKPAKPCAHRNANPQDRAMRIVDFHSHFFARPATQLANGRLTAIAVCNPLVDGAAAKLDELLSNNAYRGVLLFPAMHHYSPADPVCTPLWDVLERHRAIAYVHCGMLVVKIRDLLGLPRRYDLPVASGACCGCLPRSNVLHPALRSRVVSRDTDGRRAVREYRHRHIFLQRLDSHAAQQAKSARCVCSRARRLWPDAHHVWNRFNDLPRGMASRSTWRATRHSRCPWRRCAGPATDFRRQRGCSIGAGRLVS